jgi:hypothetical protein
VAWPGPFGRRSKEKVMVFAAAVGQRCSCDPIYIIPHGVKPCRRARSPRSFPGLDQPESSPSLRGGRPWGEANLEGANCGLDMELGPPTNPLGNRKQNPYSEKGVERSAPPLSAGFGRRWRTSHYSCRRAMGMSFPHPWRRA